MYTNKLISTFKDRFSDACAERKLPDGEIAKALEVSKQTLSAWKCGTRSPKRPTIETIARYFNVNVDWLLGFDVPVRGEGYENKKLTLEDELNKELISLLVGLTPEEVVQVRAFVAGLKAARGASASRNR